MTVTLPTPATPNVSALLDLPAEKIDAMLCRANPGVWAERKRGFTNAPFHWEWYDLAQKERRLALIAPREHAKTETLTVNMTAWRSIYTPGLYTVVFAATNDQAIELKTRIDEAIEEAEPNMTRYGVMSNKTQSVYENRSRVQVAGVGKAVRGWHPDIIIGDDVLEESATLTSYQRRKTERWWKGTVGNMAHPGTFRKIRGGKRVHMPPTRVFLVGTPFHEDDLLMGMKRNPLYRFRRYSAEYQPTDPRLGYAVEAA